MHVRLGRAMHPLLILRNARRAPGSEITLRSARSTCIDRRASAARGCNRA